MNAFKKLILLLLLLLVIGLLRAQVSCKYYGLKDTLQKNMIANLQTLSWSDEEINLALDAQVHDASGKLLYHYSVPRGIDANATNNWSQSPEDNPSDWGVLPYENGRVLHDELYLQNYTGILRWSLTLRRENDTDAVIANKELLIPVDQGIVDYEQLEDKKALHEMGYYNGLSVHLPQIAERFTLADLENITVRNTSGHFIYDDLTITLWQDSFYAPLYEVTLNNFATSPGEHSLSSEKLALGEVLDRYEERDTLSDLFFQARFTYAGLESTSISLFKHGTQFPPLEEHYNAALNISLEFVMTPDHISPPTASNHFVLLENQEGDYIDLKVLGGVAPASLQHANPCGDAFTNRNTGATLVYLVFPGGDIPNEKTGAFIATLAGLDQAYYNTVQRDSFTITFPSLNHHETLPSRKSTGGFNFAIRYNDLLYIFGIANRKEIENVAALKIDSIVNSIEINGHRLSFDFGAASTSWPTNVTVVPGSKTERLSATAYETRWKTFLLHAKENEGKTYDGWDQEETETTIISRLLSSPYPAELLEAVTYPSIQRQVLPTTGRFEFQQHTEAGFTAEWGIPNTAFTNNFSHVKGLLESIEWTTTLGIDGEGNLTQWAFLNMERDMGDVAQSVTAKGRHLMFSDQFHDDVQLTGFNFSVCRYPAAEVPKSFRPAMTLQFNRVENKKEETTLHQTASYEIYSSPLMTGFHQQMTLPGMSVLVAQEDFLYQFTVIGANKGEVLSWLNTIKVEGKSLSVSPQGEGFAIQLQ